MNEIVNKFLLVGDKFMLEMHLRQSGFTYCAGASNLVKKTDYNTKIGEIENKITTDYDHDQYITTQEFNRLTSENFTARLKQENLASKNDIANFVKITSFDEKLKTVTSNKNGLNDLSKKVKAISTK